MLGKKVTLNMKWIIIDGYFIIADIGMVLLSIPWGLVTYPKRLEEFKNGHFSYDKLLKCAHLRIIIQRKFHK